MKASVQYDDFIGTAAADISDFLGSEYGNDLESFGKHFKLDLDRFKVIGITISGRSNHFISLICVEREKSTEDKEHIVRMGIDTEEDEKILHFLFKRLLIVLHSRSDNKYSNLEYDEELSYNECHKIDTEEK